MSLQLLVLPLCNYTGTYLEISRSYNNFQCTPSWFVNGMHYHGLVKTSYDGYFITRVYKLDKLDINWLHPKLSSFKKWVRQTIYLWIKNSELVVTEGNINMIKAHIQKKSGAKTVPERRRFGKRLLFGKWCHKGVCSADKKMDPLRSRFGSSFFLSAIFP